MHGTRDRAKLLSWYLLADGEAANGAFEFGNHNPGGDTG